MYMFLGFLNNLGLVWIIRFRTFKDSHSSASVFSMHNFLNSINNIVKSNLTQFKMMIESITMFFLGF